MEAALGHQRQQADGFQGDGFTAGIGAGDHQSVEVAAQPHGDGHNGFFINERMAGAFQLQLAISADLRLHGVHGIGQLGAGKNTVDGHQHLIVVVDGVLIQGRLRRQLCQNPLNFRLFLDLQFPQFVVGVDRLHGLHKEGAAGSGHVVDQTGNVILALAFHRHHKPSGTDGHNALPQRLGIGGRRDDFLQGFPDFAALDSDMAADIRQRAAGAVGNLLLGDDGIGNPVFQIFIGRQLPEIDIQTRGNSVGVGVSLDGPGHPETGCNFQQFAGRQAAAAAGPVQAGAHVPDAAQAGRAFEGNQFTGGGGLFLKTAHFLGVGLRFQVAASFLGRVADGLGRQKVQNAVQFQFRKGFFV